MKDSKEYSKKVQKLYRQLKRAVERPDMPTYEDPLDALVYAVISETKSEADAETVIRKFSDYFVDWNDLRVALPEEILETMASHTEADRELAANLGKVLQAVFHKYNTLSLMNLQKLGKRPAKQVLEKLDATTPYIVDYIMLTSLGGHSIPLTATMIDFLKSEQLVHPESDYAEIEGFLARLIPAKNGYEFYLLLRLHAESQQPKKTRKKSTKRKTKTRTKKKTTKKKKTKKKKKTTKRKTKTASRKKTTRRKTR
jgi:endonuclease III